MPKQKNKASRGTEKTTSARAATEAAPARDFIATAVTVGVVAAGVALFEVALLPGMLIGGAAVLAPKALPALRRRLEPLFNSTGAQRAEPTAPSLDRSTAKGLLGVPAKLGIGQALAKTITFRIIVTALDFTSNYVVIGELGTSAGLSAFGFVVAPFMYLAHEAGWNYYGPPADEKIEVAGFGVGRALAKTVTFRIMATAMDFTTLYVVVGDLPTAVGLAAFGFVIGPFVYYGHEWLWDRYGLPLGPTIEMPPIERPPSEPPRLLPAPA